MRSVDRLLENLHQDDAPELIERKELREAVGLSRNAWSDLERAGAAPVPFRVTSSNKRKYYLNEDACTFLTGYQRALAAHRAQNGISKGFLNGLNSQGDAEFARR